MKPVDFLIVGQGLAGTTLAFEMLKQGLSFHIISSPEKSKASLVAAGMVNPLVFKRLTKSWMVEDLLPVMKETYQKLENILSEQLFFEKDILKPLSEQEKQLWIERKANPEFSKYIKKIFDVSPAKSIVKSEGYGLVTQSGYLNMVRFLTLAQDYFYSKSLLTNANFLFQNIHNKRRFFEVGEIKARKIIVCEGSHLRRNSFFSFIKLNPVKGEVLQIFAPELPEEYILNRGVFVLPVGDHRFKVGSTYEWEDLSVFPTEKGRKSIIDRLERLIDVDYIIENHWAGIRPAISDRRPVLGNHPELERLLIFNGLGTKGVMLAPYFAREMLKFCANPGYHLNREVQVNRFYRE